jgi:hypothetical protein
VGGGVVGGRKQQYTVLTNSANNFLVFWWGRGATTEVRGMGPYITENNGKKILPHLDGKKRPQLARVGLNLISMAYCHIRAASCIDFQIQ